MEVLPIGQPTEPTTLANPKREKFAQAFAAGATSAEAAVKAGYSPNGAKQTG